MSKTTFRSQVLWEGGGGVKLERRGGREDYLARYFTGEEAGGRSRR